MKLTIAVGERTKQLLFEKNMTQYRLAEKTCISHNTISNLINGKTADVNFSTIMLVCQALEVSLKEFGDSPLFEFENLDI